MLTANDIVYTDKANCRDCYRCLRSCPVKAIRMKDGQASVIRERCINCGTCISVCPQNAKKYRNDTEKVKDLLSKNIDIVVSIAPSFTAEFSRWEAERLPSLLRLLGFRYITQTSVAATDVSEYTEDLFRRSENPVYSSSCPAFVS
ncbi:MAG: 4Fe-4S dicluster domain-containing protein, partial [Candidatus Muiribacteriaceae bacterium]